MLRLLVNSKPSVVLAGEGQKSYTDFVGAPDCASFNGQPYFVKFSLGVLDCNSVA